MLQKASICSFSLEDVLNFSSSLNTITTANITSNATCLPVSLTIALPAMPLCMSLCLAVYVSRSLPACSLRASLPPFYLATQQD